MRVVVYRGIYRIAPLVFEKVAIRSGCLICVLRDGMKMRTGCGRRLGRGVILSIAGGCGQAVVVVLLVGVVLSGRDGIAPDTVDVVNRIGGGGEGVCPSRVGGRRIAAWGGDAGRDASGPGDDLFKGGGTPGRIWLWLVFAGGTLAQRRSVSRRKMQSGSEDIVFLLEFSNPLLKSL